MRNKFLHESSLIEKGNGWNTVLKKKVWNFSFSSVIIGSMERARKVEVAFMENLMNRAGTIPY